MFAESTQKQTFLDTLTALVLKSSGLYDQMKKIRTAGETDCCDYIVSGFETGRGPRVRFKFFDRYSQLASQITGVRHLCDVCCVDGVHNFILRAGLNATQFQCPVSQLCHLSLPAGVLVY